MTVSVPVPMRLLVGQPLLASSAAVHSDAAPPMEGVKPFCSVSVMPVGSIVWVGTLTTESVNFETFLGVLGLSEPRAASGRADAVDVLAASASIMSEVMSEAVLDIAVLSTGGAASLTALLSRRRKGPRGRGTR